MANEGIAFSVQHGLQRQVLRVQQGVILGLPIIRIDRLLEITLAVKQTHPDESEPEVAGRLGVIPRQPSQAAGGDRQGLVETELRREIRDRVGTKLWRMSVSPGVGLVHVSLERLQHLAHALREVQVLQAHAQFVIRYLVENGHCVVIEVLPAAGGEFLENLLRFLVPGPPEIPGQLAQAGR